MRASRPERLSIKIGDHEGFIVSIAIKAEMASAFANAVCGLAALLSPKTSHAESKLKHVDLFGKGASGLAMIFCGDARA